jgi:hypothetical protein
MLSRPAFGRANGADACGWKRTMGWGALALVLFLMTGGPFVAPHDPSMIDLVNRLPSVPTTWGAAYSAV